MTRIGMPAAIFLLAVSALGLIGGPARATTTLSGVGAGTIGFVVDGASNTILLGETSRLSVCVDNASFSQPVGSFQDGSSNTIFFGESPLFGFQGGFVRPRQPIGAILDGTSNTILVGEAQSDALCFGEVEIVAPVTDGTSNTIQIGEGSRFDACFRNVAVGAIQDGTSNTILFGEASATPVCFEEVQVDPSLDAPTASVPAPPAAMLALVGCAVGVFGAARRRA